MNDWGAEPLEGLPQIGQMFGGKYRLERVLGVGGMGVVVEVTHAGLGEKMAVKFLSSAEARDPERMTRFKREAWAAAKIKSEHVARVSDVAELDDGTVFLVMEYLEGHDLEASLAEGPMPVETAVDYLLQASEALAEAHKLGIVHRDLKPGNLFLTRRADGSPCVKVLDFGVSKFAQAGAMTQTSELMGSPLYMAPEQIMSAKHVDARVDIWALGVILYELVAGKPPFDGDTLPVLIKQVLGGKALPLREAAPHVTAAFDAAVMHCLSNKPEERYADLAELATALEQHGSPAARASTKFIHGVLVGRAATSAESSSSSVVAVDGSRPQIADDDTEASEEGQEGLGSHATVATLTGAQLGK